MLTKNKLIIVIGLFLAMLVIFYFLFFNTNNANRLNNYPPPGVKFFFLANNRIIKQYSDVEIFVCKSNDCSERFESIKPRYCEKNYCVFTFEDNFTWDSYYVLNFKFEEKYTIKLKNEVKNMAYPFLGYKINVDNDEKVTYTETKYFN